MNNNSFIFQGQTYTTGDSVTCTIKRIFAENAIIKDAKVMVVDPKKFYICQNVAKGNTSPHLLGYDYSWKCNILSHGLSDGVKDLQLACKKPKDPS